MRKLLLIGFLFILWFILIQKNKEAFQSYSRAMVIIEPRQHKDFQKVLELFDKTMPSDWDIYIFHGKSSEEFAKKAVNTIKRRTVLYPLETDNLTAEEYNSLLKEPSLYEKINAEDILIFQTDAALCSKTPFKLENFTKYDYIGCSVNNSSIGKENTPWGTHQFYGVGGLSFRKKSFALKCISDMKDKLTLAEDVFFSECVANSPNKPPSAKVLNDFCTQNEFHEQSFGAHQTKLLKEEDRQKFYEYCPESLFLKEQFKNLL